MEERTAPPKTIQPLHDPKSSSSSGGRRKSKTEIGINVSNLYARWNKDSDMLTLDNINLTLKEGQLAAVVGSIGSGKVCN